MKTTPDIRYKLVNIIERDSIRGNKNKGALGGPRKWLISQRTRETRGGFWRNPDWLITLLQGGVSCKSDAVTLCRMFLLDWLIWELGKIWFLMFQKISFGTEITKYKISLNCVFDFYFFHWCLYEVWSVLFIFDVVDILPTKLITARSIWSYWTTTKNQTWKNMEVYENFRLYMILQKWTIRKINNFRWYSQTMKSTGSQAYFYHLSWFLWATLQVVKW